MNPSGPRNLTSLLADVLDDVDLEEVYLSVGTLSPNETVVRFWEDQSPDLKKPDKGRDYDLIASHVFETPSTRRSMTGDSLGQASRKAGIPETRPGPTHLITDEAAKSLESQHRQSFSEKLRRGQTGRTDPNGRHATLGDLSSLRSLVKELERDLARQRYVVVNRLFEETDTTQVELAEDLELSQTTIASMVHADSFEQFEGDA